MGVEWTLKNCDTQIISGGYTSESGISNPVLFTERKRVANFSQKPKPRLLLGLIPLKCLPPDLSVRSN